MTYIDRVKTCINDCKQRYQALENKGLLWDAITAEIRGNKEIVLDLDLTQPKTT